MKNGDRHQMGFTKSIVMHNRKYGGWGCIIRDHKGAFMAAAAGHLEFLSSALHAESLACLKGLELQQLFGCRKC